MFESCQKSKNIKIENVNIKEKKKRRKGERTPALRVIRAETRLTVYRSLPYGCVSQLVGSQTNVDLFIILSVFS